MRKDKMWATIFMLILGSLLTLFAIIKFYLPHVSHPSMIYILFTAILEGGIVLGMMISAYFVDLRIRSGVYSQQNQEQDKAFHEGFKEGLQDSEVKPE